MKFFWPLYLTSLAAGTAGVYVAAPLARPFMAALKGPPAAEAPAEAPPAGAIVSRPAQPAPAPAPARPKPPAETAGAADEDTPPAMHGVFLASRGDRPAWGVTNQRTTYYKPDGTRMGNVAGGVLFDIRDSRSSSKGLMLECSLFKNGVTNGPYLVSRKDVHLFTGSHAALSPRQIEALETYYALNGKIGARKNELLQASAAKNPYFSAYQSAYKVYMDHIEQAKTLTDRRDKATEMERARLDDRLREMKVAETKLRADYEAIHQKFKAWKEAHAHEIAKPENDPEVKRWAFEMSQLRSRIPGLAL